MSASNSSSSNPFCFLPHELALQLTASKYITLGALSVFVWEILNNILSDYKLLSEHRLRIPTVVYFISRIFCLGSVVFAVVFDEGKAVPLCHRFQKALATLFSLTVIFTSLLFFFRTRAVFDQNPWIVAFFVGLWLAVVAGCLCFIFGISFLALPMTNELFCPVSNRLLPFTETTALIPLINDTFVFLAITWRLYCNSYARRTFKESMRMLIFGRYLPAFSKAILQDGQAYYLTIVTFNLITVIFLFNPSIPIILRAVFIGPNIALMNIMACRVFRKTIFGFFRETQISTSVISRELDAVIPLSLREAGHAPSNTGGIVVTQTIEHTYDRAVPCPRASTSGSDPGRKSPNYDPS